MAILVLVVGQFVLPPLAEHIISDRLARHGRVLSVSISAFPAVELLFGDADTVKVRMASYTASESQMAAQLQQARGVSNMNVSIGTVSSGLVNVTSVTMIKHGSQITGRGYLSEASLRSAVPILQSVTPVSSGDGQLTLQGTASALGLSYTGDATVAARGGKVVVAGDGLLSFFGELTVWSDPHVKVESVAGQSAPGGLTVSARARLS